MSILFKGNLEEGNYTLIKSTDGWVLKGETSYVGFNFADRLQGEWIDRSNGIESAWNYCSVCGKQAIDLYDFCPNCGADMRKGVNDE